MQPPPRRLRIGLYFLVNAGFVLTVLALAGIGGSSNPRILHLILLFAVCSTPVLDLDGLNGQYVMPSLFLAFYFVSFGLLDFLNLGKGLSSEASPSLFSKTEGVILAGGVMLTLGYRAAMLFGARSTVPRQARDWPMKSIVVIGTSELFYWNIILIPDSSAEAAKKGLETAGTYGTAVLLVARMLQPFGILLMAYAWRLTHSRLLFFLIIVAVVVQVVLGFAMNVKGEAMIAGILVIVTY